MPQNELFWGGPIRQGALLANQLKYVWTESSPNLSGIPMAQTVPLDNFPTLEWLLKAAVTIADLLVNAIASLLKQIFPAQAGGLNRYNSQLASLRSQLATVQSSYSDLRAQASAGDAGSAVLAVQAQALQGTLSGVVTQLVALQASLKTEVTALSGRGGFKDDDAASLARYDQMFATLPKPAIAQNFRDDEMFAHLRVAGPNPMLLARASSLPAKFPLTNAQYQSVMGTADSLQGAAAAGRLYLADYVGLGAMGDERPVSKLLSQTGYASAPIALFAVPAGGGALQPVAIQCGQAPGTYPVIVRSSASGSGAYWTWQMAKTVVQVADFNYHEMFVHLGRTHLLSEAFAIATYRQLAPNHPINVLLVPHFEGTLFINDLAGKVIMGPGTFGDVILAAPIGILQAGAGNDRLALDFYAAMLPSDLKARGVDTDSTLSDYPYRDDALLVWNAIRQWVADYVALYYLSDADVTGDTELAAWTADVIDNGKVKGFRSIRSRAQLIDVLTMIVFTASAQHAAVNYPQRDFMTYIPAFAGMAGAATPAAKTAGNGAADWFALMPQSRLTDIEQLNFLSLLGGVHYRPLGDYRQREFPYLPVLTDPRVVQAGGPLDRFRQALKTIESQIGGRNRTRKYPYGYLLPSRIPTSTNI
ncbi:lipoxygenase family protein [Burkholderia alba]|uniref:lipoxygenase family protein n=1 Tax=Burkholderia alba TaxID=2683677 RepID=UPI002B060733|nr:lipoxygenase family protein [Burkholderia alba]